MNKNNEFNDQSIKEVDNVIYFAVRQDHASARDYLEHMSSKYKIVFEEEVKRIIKTIDFDEDFGKIFKIAVLKGIIFEGQNKYPYETLDFAKELGYDGSSVLAACLIFERAMEERMLFDFSFLLVITPTLVDKAGDNCHFSLISDDKKELVLFYEEPVLGLHTNMLDGYAFSKIEN